MKPLIIKNAGFGVGDCAIVLGIILILGGGIVSFDEITTPTLNIKFIILYSVVLIILFVGLYKTIKRIKDSKQKIIINEKGIEICASAVLFEWSNVKCAYIHWQKKYMGKDTKYFFHIEYYINDDCDEKYVHDYHIELTDFHYNKKQLTKAINYFSGREIGSYINYLSGKIKEIAAGNEQTYRIIAKKFDQYFKREQYLAIPIILGIWFFAGWQSQSEFPYIFAFGLLLSLCLAFFVAYLNKQYFKSQEEIRFLRKEEFVEIKNEFARFYSLHLEASKTGRRILYSILGLCVIAAFVVSYFVSK
ncbi:MAG: hypothetical protein LBR55_03550 [Bacteroidales bacterium]|jgi:hypothetical protein|nr:hypothetical protein [Bacteroidales bacterium]